MTNIEPYVAVYDVEKITQQGYGNAGRIALIGAFPTKTFKMGLFTSYDEAREALKGAYRTADDNSVANAALDVVPSTYISFYCLDYLFGSSRQSRGPESVLIVNTNYGVNTLTPSLDASVVDDALAILDDEDFDILTLGFNTPLVTEVSSTNVLNPLFAKLKAFENSKYQAQKPFGIITGIDMTDATPAIVTSFKTLFADRGIYKAIATKVRLNGEAESLNIAESGCWHAAYTAGRPVNKSETSKVYDELIGENSKDAYPLTGTVTWRTLLNAGFHTTKYKNRRLQTIQCLSNITPADYDMKIERVKNYIIRRLSLEDYLGENNDGITRASIKGEFEYEKQLAIQNGYLVDMEYNLVNVTSTKVQANLKLYIPDIIRVIELNVAVEITAYEE